MAVKLNSRKPRKAAASKPMSDAGTAGDGRTLSRNDNRAAVLEAEQAQYLSFFSQAAAKQTEIDAAKAVVKERADEQAEIYRLAGIAGFKKYEFTDQMKDTKASRRDVAAAEQKRHRLRTYLGLPVGKSDEQLELETRQPDTAKDDAFWRGDGYTAGLRGVPCKPPGDAGVHGQAWMDGWGKGQEHLVLSMGKAKELAKPAPVVEPEPPKAIADERLEEKREERLVKEALEKNLSGGEEEPDADKVFGPGDDGFEASEEELAAQSTRQAVVGAREGGDEEDDGGEAV